ncbi:dienelactone hydrolase family protein [uncultured Erythrobacter sp.]|uniref:alpha/beta hydrolase family protein n=1 Tax=uncultured Erythrobacter sp. TaxID=263913 RepID=UPI00262A2095|nr:dienelactone hydrolase family protein [uncultured Erythrobacter sp.]
MKKRYLLAGALGLTAIVVGGGAYVVAPTIHPGQTGEAPELGRHGSYAIGTVEVSFELANRSAITGTSLVTGNLEPVDRSIQVRIWYPAVPGTGEDPQPLAHLMEMPRLAPFEIVSQSIARPDAEAATGEKYPLVLISHGFGGWNTQLSNLAEHLATRGYVTASIDHDDMPVDSPASFIVSFGNVLADRTVDQLQVLEQLVTNANTAQLGYPTLIDVGKIGVIGYSMGGYGAITTAGASYRTDEGPLSNLPTASIERMAEAEATELDIDALVALAPWGGQPDNRAWSQRSLAELEVPTLIISGDQDDIVNFDQGVSWLFNNMVNSDRYLLVYREARHNIAGNQFDVGPDVPFSATEFLREPVWRTDRLNAINQHFVTSFLDWKLKGRAEAAAYLDVPTTDSNESEWPIGFNEHLNGTLAGEKQDSHWRGFQRRWAVGMDLHIVSAGERGEISTRE